MKRTFLPLYEVEYLPSERRLWERRQEIAARNPGLRTERRRWERRQAPQVVRLGQ